MQQVKNVWQNAMFNRCNENAKMGAKSGNMETHWNENYTTFTTECCIFLISDDSTGILNWPVMAAFLYLRQPLETDTLSVWESVRVILDVIFVFKPLLNRIFQHSQNNCYDGTINSLLMSRIK